MLELVIFEPIFLKFKFEMKHSISNSLSKWVKSKYHSDRFENCGNRIDYLPLIFEKLAVYFLVYFFEIDQIKSLYKCTKIMKF